jgi:hypothetical protein
VHRSPPDRHLVRCIYCRAEFDLFGATWCGHRNHHPSKICPLCLMCLCQHPLYKDPRQWLEAPPAFLRHGFRQVFILYG